ncbi:MAG: DUF6807 family protein [Puniceicoccaceae bacterium]
MVRWFCSLVVVGVTAVPAVCADEGVVAVDEVGLVNYQAVPIADPVGGDQFKGSNFIHPLKTPSGFTITDSQPEDHLHHFGVWWPWKHIEVDERQILCWELQQGDGLIEAKDHKRIRHGLVTSSLYIDRKADGGPVSRLAETTVITTSPLLTRPARGYYLDIMINERTARDETVTVTPYRYSGFSIRCTSFWRNHNSSLLTSEGKSQVGSNFTEARWVLIQGATDQGDSAGSPQAGVLLMSHPSNQSHPELLRTWENAHDGIHFVNFNTVQKDPWIFEPGNNYQRRYRLFVFDGEITPAEADGMWQRYSD